MAWWRSPSSKAASASSSCSAGPRRGSPSGCSRASSTPHFKTGDIITETGLEKPLLLINDLPTASVTSEIRPSQTVGAADLRVNVDQGVGLFNGYVDFDNQGSRFTGEHRLRRQSQHQQPADHR